jgi:hypothetical protein
MPSGRGSRRSSSWPTQPMRISSQPKISASISRGFHPRHLRPAARLRRPLAASGRVRSGRRHAGTYRRAAGLLRSWPRNRRSGPLYRRRPRRPSRPGRPRHPPRPLPRPTRAAPAGAGRKRLSRATPARAEPALRRRPGPRVPDRAPGRPDRDSLRFPQTRTSLGHPTATEPRPREKHLRWLTASPSARATEARGPCRCPRPHVARPYPRPQVRLRPIPVTSWPR